MTRSDKWKQRPGVMRYRAFADEVRLRKVDFKTGDHVHFIFEMPASWSKKMKSEFDMTQHKGKPDSDNCVKSLMDALYKDDSYISDFRVTKWWGRVPAICIEPMSATQFPLNK